MKRLKDLEEIPPKASNNYVKVKASSSRLLAFALYGFLGIVFPGAEATAAPVIKTSFLKADETTPDQTDAAKKNRLIESMVKSTRNGPPNKENVDRLKKDLCVLPLPLLALIRDNKFFFLKPGESLLSTGIYKPVDTKDYSTPDLQKKAKQLNAKLVRIDSEDDPELIDLRGITGIKALHTPRENIPEHWKLRYHETAKRERIADAIRESDCKLAGIGKYELRKYASLGDLAKGISKAKTSAEVREYLGHVIKLNPDLFRGKNVSKIEEELPPNLGTSNDYPYLGPEKYLIVPAYEYDNELNGAEKSASAQALGLFDRARVKKWDTSHGISTAPILGMSAGNCGAAFLRSGDWSNSVNGNNTAVHESAHLIEEELERNSNPMVQAMAKKLFQSRDIAYKRAMIEQKLITRHAGDNKREFLAESIAAYFSPHNHEKLRILDPEWFLAIEKFISDSKHLPSR